MRQKIFIYPRLPASLDIGFFRFGGSGLANCMFIAARAYLLSKKYNLNFVAPTWTKLSIGPYLRFEKDKRHYFGLFKLFGVSGIKKIFVLWFYPKIDLAKFSNTRKGLVIIEGLGNYFEDIKRDYRIVKQYFDSILNPNVLKIVNSTDFTNVIAIHIRLGDYVAQLRTNISWYKSILNQIESLTQEKFRFFVFSDGRDDELSEILQTKNVHRVYFGNALADIYAMSRCKLIIGSDSSFSAWGAFLNQVPIIFPKRHFSSVLVNQDNELVVNLSTEHLTEFLIRVLL